jgi:hypothetical protein
MLANDPALAADGLSASVSSTILLDSASCISLLFRAITGTYPNAGPATAAHLLLTMTDADKLISNITFSILRGRREYSGASAADCRHRNACTTGATAQ